MSVNCIIFANKAAAAAPTKPKAGIKIKRTR
jgi:hypothetical protein